MKHLFFLICISLAIFCNGQNVRFIYNYEYVPDSTNHEVKLSELMFLDVLPKKSEFFSRSKYLSDSAQLAADKKGMFYMPPRDLGISYKVIKKNTGEVLYENNEFELATFVVPEIRRIDWVITDERKSVLNYVATKAVGHFAGREWVAWFAEDVPLSDGPYKFRGLPGLIVEIHDHHKFHNFSLAGVEKLSSSYAYPSANKPGEPMTYAEYKKNLNSYRNDPAAKIRMKYMSGKIPDQRDHNGDRVSGMEVVRKVEKALKEKILRNNNLLELDLLTQ